MNMEEGPRRLWNHNFVLLWNGQLVSQLGTQAFAIAVLFWIKGQTGSASLVAMVHVVASLPAALLGPIGGTLADRFSRRTIIIWSDFIRGVASVSMGVLVFWGPEQTRLILVFMLVTNFLMGATGSFFRPAITASIPDIVPEKRITTANSLNRISIDLSTLLGLGIGGILFQLLGAGLLILADGVTYLLAGVSKCFVTIPQEIPEKSTEWREVLTEFGHETVNGVRYVWSRKGLRFIMFLIPFDAFFITSIVVLLPFYVEDVLGATPAWFGYLAATFGAGSLVGSLVAGTVPLRGTVRCNVILASSVMFGLTAGLLGPAPSTWVALLVIFAAGVTNGFNAIHMVSLIQLTTPSELRGRVFGLMETLGLSATPIAAGLAGVIADLTDQNIPAIYMASGGALVLVAIVMMFHPAVRRFLSYEHTEDAEETDAAGNATT
ncbi:MAG: MFS transporter [bacterium]|nr:MFS transporter [bacterium]